MPPTPRDAVIGYALELSTQIERYRQSDWFADQYRMPAEIAPEHREMHRFLLTTGGRVPSPAEVVALLSMRLGAALN